MLQFHKSKLNSKIENDAIYKYKVHLNGRGQERNEFENMCPIQCPRPWPFPGITQTNVCFM